MLNYVRSVKHSQYLPLILLGLCISAYIVLYGRMSVYRHLYFNSHGYDLGIQDQAIWNTAHGRWYHTSVETHNYLGDHFKPLIALLAPFYLIYPSVYWLLFFQTVVLALGAIPVYRLAQRRLQLPGAGLVFAILYLTYPAIGYINREDFHWEATVVPLFLAAVDAFDARQFKWASGWLALAILGKEEMGLTAAAFGLRAMTRQRIRFGLAWVIIGLSVSLITLLVIIPSIRGTDSDTLSRYIWLGEHPLEWLQTIFLRPGYVLQNLAWADIGVYYWQLLSPVMFLPLFSPLNWIPLLPSMGYNLLSDYHPQRTIRFQYVAPTVPFIFVAAIYGAEKIFNRLEDRERLKMALLALLVINLFLVLGRPPFAQGINWLRQNNETTVHQALAIVPPTTSLYTTNPYAPHLSQRETLFVHHRSQSHQLCQVDTIFFNLQDRRTLGLALSMSEYLAMLRQAQACGFRVLFFEDEVLVLQRGDNTEALPPLTKTTVVPVNLNLTMVDANNIPQVRVLGYNVTSWYSQGIVDIYVEALTELETDYKVNLHVVANGMTVNLDVWPAQPTSVWQPNNIYVVSYRTTSHFPEYHLSVSFSEQDGSAVLYDRQSGESVIDLGYH